MQHDLSRFFRPSTVAIVGASDTPGRPATMNTRFLLDWAERVGSTTFLVNPNRDSVAGTPCYSGVEELPGPIDVLITLAPNPAQTLRAAANLGVQFAVVFAAGFAETGAEGAAAQEELVRAAHDGGMRLLGPNTNLNAFESFRTDLEGPSIALISQSGHQGRGVFMVQDNNVPVSHWAPTGNEADLEFADFASWFAHNPAVGVIAAYVEEFRSGAKLATAARHCIEQKTPMVVVKVGRSSTGRAAATSHTGKLAGSDQVADGFFRQHGITRVDTIDQLADTATMLLRGGRPAAEGVAVYSISGGTSAHAADVCAEAGIPVPRLEPRTQEALREWIPGYLKVDNPVDCGGHPVGDERGPKILDAIMADPNIGALLCVVTAPFAPLSDRLAADLVALAERSAKPVCVVWGSPVGTEKALLTTLYGSQQVITFRSLYNAALAMRSWIDWHRHLRSRRASEALAIGGSEPLPAGVLSEHAAKEVLRRYDIPTTNDVLAHSEDEAVHAWLDLGSPVVLKACSAAIAHKSEHGLVVAGLDTEDAVRSAYRRLASTAEQLAPGAVEGVLVCEQASGGVEAALGITTDPVFGATVMLALGGTLIELFADTSIRVPPFGRDEARRMIEELRGHPLLTGYRGSKPADVEALADTIMAVQRLALEHHGTLRELDINPLLIKPSGEGAVALDALIRTETTEDCRR
ncbi:acetate--CoA ligase family protein [Nocardia australiensis]|uniref:acetate--CoA ligase family protein n=1 Tax=Nocardia australiensis TaxID=2887191 RepID=UPI001D148063|nr:acetate--CoA ligase family protein [Nocardia australiensis]